MPYRISCVLPRKADWVNVTYLANKKPLEKVIGNTKAKAAMCGLMANIPKSTTCLLIMKL